MIYVKKCVVCGNTFTSEKKSKLSCSEECRSKRNSYTTRIYYANMIKEAKEEKECVICGRVFVPINKRATCCSKECQDERNRRYAVNHKAQYEKKAKVTKKKKQKYSIKDISDMAAKEGLSYGEYVAKYNL